MVQSPQTRIQQHVNQRGHESIAVTQGLCVYWWRRFNNVVFDGVLTPPAVFDIKGFYHNTIGWCQPFHINSSNRRVIIGINNKIQNRELFLNVLCHEMVHQYQWEIGAIWDNSISEHGRTFFAWSNITKSIGLCLHRSYVW